MGYDGLGAGLWALTFVLPGYVFSSEIEAIAAQLSRAGMFFLVALGIGLVAYIGYKFAHRQWVLRELRMARMTVDELKGMMDKGYKVFVLDLRGALDHEVDPYTIPGALRMTAEELEQGHADFPRQGDVILFWYLPKRGNGCQDGVIVAKERYQERSAPCRRHRRLA